MRIPSEVDTFLRRVSALRNPALGIEPLTPDEALRATADLWRISAVSRGDLLPEEMGFIVLTAGHDPYGFGTRGAAAGRVIWYPHDATAEVAFPSLDAFASALRTALATDTAIWDLPRETATDGPAGDLLHPASSSASEGLSTPTAQAFVDALAEAPLLACVGEPLPGDWDAVAVTSWKDALHGTRNRHKTNQHLEARNAFTTSLSRHHPQDYGTWNELVRRWRPVIQSIVIPICETVVEQERLRRSPVDDLSWDLLGACLEYEYAPVQRPAFYHRLAGFYLAGHFPCGYEGWYPHGRHEIF